MKQSKKLLPDGESQSESPALRGLAPALAPLLSGVLIALAFPPYNLHFLAWIALAPVIVATRRASRRGALFIGYIYILVFLSILLWWLAVVRYPAVIAYAIFTVLLPFIFLPWASAINRLPARLPGVAAAVAASAIWVVYEWVFSHGQFAFPWFALGNTQIKNIYAAQAASLGGVYLVSFEVLMVNFFAASLIEKRAGKEKAGWIAAGAVFVLLIGYGIVSVPRTAPAGPGVTVAAIQANYPYELKDEEGMTLTSIYNTHNQMTIEAAMNDKPDIVVWSESVAWNRWLTGPMYLDSVKNMISSLDITLVAGAYEYDEEENFYNSVVAFEPGSDPLGNYRKMQTVPFGEVFPYRSVIEKISPALGTWITENVHETDVTAGTEFTVFNGRHGKFATLVCFDSVIPSIPRKLAAGGAEFMFVLSNDAWSPSSVGLVQHAMQGAMRAVENRRYIVQSTNNGLTDIIDPWGREIARAPMHETYTLRGEIWPIKKLTPYTRFGDWFCLLCAAVSAAAIVAFRMRK